MKKNFFKIKKCSWHPKLVFKTQEEFEEFVNDEKQDAVLRCKVMAGFLESHGVSWWPEEEDC